MRRFLALTLVALALTLPGPSAEARDDGGSPPIALVVHGGAGSIRPDDLTREREAAYRAGLASALGAGRNVLESGGSALDAVERAIRAMEDSPLFNAGKGAVFTAEGKNELDASIMVGSTRQAGAVAGVTRIKNPISAARAVMEQTPHVLLAGAGAERFAERVGLELVEPGYFFTRRRWDALQKAKRRRSSEVEGARGTVGAVALDAAGVLVAGTSTGGMTNKLQGRVGDSPIVGAGTWADHGCAVSATGDGEYFIRFAIARSICSRVELLDEPIERAADELIHGELTTAGGGGGVIALTRRGDGQVDAHWTFNTPGMFRAAVDAGGAVRIALYGEDGAEP